MTYTVYIVRCSDDTLYTGIAVDVEKRLKEHNGEVQGGAKYTNGRRPVRLVYTELQASRSDAQVREYALKKLSRSEKNTLISSQKKRRQRYTL